MSLKRKRDVRYLGMMDEIVDCLNAGEVDDAVAMMARAERCWKHATGAERARILSGLDKRLDNPNMIARKRAIDAISPDLPFDPRERVTED